ncbi:MAG: hypothetical protein DCC75_04515 [Proteobacteria bacterium]|nr:MAG: hypothetical protein DCC75_04515 [Pseudomonadota bacterium]
MRTSIKIALLTAYLCSSSSLIAEPIKPSFMLDQTKDESNQGVQSVLNDVIGFVGGMREFLQTEEVQCLRAISCIACIKQGVWNCEDFWADNWAWCTLNPLNSVLIKCYQYL